MELAEMARLTSFIRKNTVFIFMAVWKLLIDFCRKLRNAVMTSEFDD